MAKCAVAFSLMCYLSLMLIGSSFAAEPACRMYHSQDIEDGERMKNGSVLHDGILYPLRYQFIYKPATNGIRISGVTNRYDYDLPVMEGDADMNNTVTQVPDVEHLRGCTCLLRTCVRKCCPAGMALVGRNCERTALPVPEFRTNVLTDASDVTKIVPWDARKYGVLHGNTCVNATRYDLQPDKYSEDEYYLYQNGSVYVPEFTGDLKFIDHTSYCLDWRLAENSSALKATSDKWEWLILVCTHTEPDTGEVVNVLFSVFPIGLIVSIVFLLLTLLVYLVLPELHTLHGKALMQYVGALAIAYSFLATIQTRSNGLSDGECLGYALTAYYTFILSFFWLNVMSFDIWWAFSGMGGFRGGVREAERKKFLCYLAYAWGGATAIFSIALAMHYHPSVPHRLKPGFAGYKCWLQDSSIFAYFYLPMVILVIANVVLFSATAFRIRAINQETKMLRGDGNTKHSQVEDDQQRFWLYIKLFLVMGVNWTMEIISWLVGGSKWLWIATDIFNSIQGLLIFLIFVYKPKIRKLLIRRYNTLKGTPLPSSVANTRSMTSSSGATQMTTMNDGNGNGVKQAKEEVLEKALLAKP